MKILPSPPSFSPQIPNSQSLTALATLSMSRVVLNLTLDGSPALTDTPDKPSSRKLIRTAEFGNVAQEFAAERNSRALVQTRKEQRRDKEGRKIKRKLTVLPHAAECPTDLAT